MPSTAVGREWRCVGGGNSGKCRSSCRLQRTLPKDRSLRVFDSLHPHIMAHALDTGTKKKLQRIRLHSVKAGPRDKDGWTDRLKEELTVLIECVEGNKKNDCDWFSIECHELRWTGKCWYVHNMLRYEFDMQFEIPVTYPTTAPEIELPELDGKTPKMYRGGKICLTDHFKPLWARNVPKFGVAHALTLGLGPWMAAEIPVLAESGVIQPKEGDSSK